MNVTDEELIKTAMTLNDERQITKAVRIGSFGSALVTDQGNVYAGTSIDASCSVGFCAEHNAIGSMLTAGESKIDAIVAVHHRGEIVSPCGRCREFIYQLHPDNKYTRVILKEGESMPLEALLPRHWTIEKG